MCASHLSLPVGAGRVESLCLARFLFSIQNIPSAPLVVFKLIVKPTRLLARPKEYLACVCKQLSEEKLVQSTLAKVNGIRVLQLFSCRLCSNWIIYCLKKVVKKLKIIVLDKCLQMTHK